MSGGVPLSDRAKTKKALEAFEDFTGHKGEVIDIVDMPDIDTAYVLGELTGVTYRTVRDGKTEHYLHEFKNSAIPLLCVSHDGKQLLIVGGDYFVNEAGINDR